MAATIESLLAENQLKVQEFLEALEELKKTMDESVLPLDESPEKMIREFNHSSELMAMVKNTLEVVDGALEKSGQELDDQLEHIDEHAEQLETKIEAIDADAKQVFSDLEAGEAQLDAVDDEKFKSVSNDLKQIRETASGLETLIGDRRGDLSTSSTGYVNDVGGGFERLEQRYLDHVEGYDKFAVDAAEIMETDKKTMDETLEAIKQELDEVFKGFDSTVRESLQEATEAAKEKAAQEAQASIDEAKQQVESAHQPVQEAQDVIDTDVATATEKAATVTETIAQANGNLERLNETI